MADPLATTNNFRSLSLRDLLEARDLYHFHLTNKTNVVGTAVGLYLIRKDEPEPDHKHSTRAPQTSRDRGPRTFMNSEVRDYSWPCVLVLVSEWTKPSHFGIEAGKLHPEEMVPRTLYLPDGRMVPVCVVKVEQGEPSPPALPGWHWPRGTFGSGLPIYVSSQNAERMATVGCLVTDGHKTYALTSQHVSGEGGLEISAQLRGRRFKVGTASRKSLGRLPFGSVYPNLPARQTFVNMDVGLVELDDINQWTSSVYGLGTPGPMADLNDMNLTLRLIDAPVVGSGAASGRLEGRIKALFYRYKSVGGFDYVSDFLIEPTTLDGQAEAPPPMPHPGDSGMLWHLVSDSPEPPLSENKKDHSKSKSTPSKILRPLAIQWGGQVFVDGPDSKEFAFSLATSLTTVCRELDVECVLTHNRGAQPYWGQTGHYGIASFAVATISNSTKLKKLLDANLDRISFSLDTLSADEIKQALKYAREHGELIPLADVPDLIWKKYKSKPGGRDTQILPQFRTTGPEHPTHYADIDEKDSTGLTLRQACLNDEANVDVDFWRQFYTALNHTEQSKRGLLPFRIWQFFDEMVEFVKAKDVASFVCAAGILSHYVGDACQPLHGSIYADGYPDGPGEGVHSAYETAMVDRVSKRTTANPQGLLIPAITAAVENLVEPAPAIRDIVDGRSAAIETVRMMERVAQRIPPTSLVDAYVDAGGNDHVATLDSLWDSFGDATAEVMADGARLLARIWEGAWESGNGDTIGNNKLVAVDPGVLKGLYETLDFIESLDLDHIGAVLQ